MAHSAKVRVQPRRIGLNFGERPQSVAKSAHAARSPACVVRLAFCPEACYPALIRWGAPLGLRGDTANPPNLIRSVPAEGTEHPKGTQACRSSSIADPATRGRYDADCDSAPSCAPRVLPASPDGKPDGDAPGTAIPRRPRMKPFAPLAAALLAALTTLNPLPAAAQDKMTVVLDWFVNPNHGPLIIAQEKGYFADAGLEVEIIAPADPSAPPRMAAAGKADLALSYQPQLHLQVAEGLPLKRVGTLIASPLNCLLVLEDGPIETVADLKGRKIGFSVAGVEEALLSKLLGDAD